MNDGKMTNNTVEAEYMDIANKNAWPLVYQVRVCVGVTWFTTHATHLFRRNQRDRG